MRSPQKPKNARSKNARFVSVLGYASCATPSVRRLFNACSVLCVRCVFAVDAVFGVDFFITGASDGIGGLLATFCFWVSFAVRVGAASVETLALIVAVLATVFFLAIEAVFVVGVIFAEQTAVHDNAGNNFGGAVCAVFVDFDTFGARDANSNTSFEVSEFFGCGLIWGEEQSKSAAAGLGYARCDVADSVFDLIVLSFLAFAQSYSFCGWCPAVHNAVFVISVGWVCAINFVVFLAVFVVFVFFERAVDFVVFLRFVVFASCESQGREQRDEQKVNTSHDTLLYA